MFRHHWNFPSPSNFISKLNHIKQKYETTLSCMNITWYCYFHSSGCQDPFILFVDHKKSVMPQHVFNDKRSFINLQLRCRIIILFVPMNKRLGKRSYLPSFNTLYCTSCRQPGVVKLPQVPKSRKPISEHLISITRYIYNNKKAIQATPDN